MLCSVNTATNTYYREGRTDQLKTMLDHSDEKYQCKEMSDCPYTGTTLINNIPWAVDEDQAEKSDTCIA